MSKSKINSEKAKARSPEGVRYITYVVAYREGETPPQTFIGAPMQGGVCTGIALYDGMGGLTIAENALTQIERGETDPVEIISDAQQELDRLMSGSDWRLQVLNDEPGESGPYSPALNN